MERSNRETFILYLCPVVWCEQHMNNNLDLELKIVSSSKVLQLFFPYDEVLWPDYLSF